MRLGFGGLVHDSEAGVLVGVAVKPPGCARLQHLLADVVAIDFDSTQEPAVRVTVESVGERDELGVSAADELFQEGCRLVVPAFAALGGVELWWLNAFDTAIEGAGIEGVPVDD